MLISLLALSACSGGAGPPASFDQPSDPGAAQAEAFSAKAFPTAAELVERVEIGGLTTLPIFLANSVETLTGSHDYIVAARVTDVAVGYPLAESLVEHLIPKTPLPPDHIKAGVAPDPDGKIGPVGSRYRLQVVRVIQAPDLAVGDSFDITAWGGMIDGVRYEDAGDPLREVGTSYLLFLDKPGSNTFTSLPFGRFELVAGDRLRPVSNHYDVFGAVVELRDLTLVEAIVRVKAVLLAQAFRPLTVGAAEPGEVAAEVRQDPARLE